MGVDTAALGFFAGFTGKFIVEEVMNLGCLCRPVWTDGITRINTYVNDGQHEYGIPEPLVLRSRRSTRRSSTTSWTPRAISSA